VTSTEADQLTASAIHGHEDFITAALQGLSGTTATEALTIEAPGVEPMPNVLGDDSSSSKGGQRWFRQGLHIQ
jgi:hypothetical protein